MKQRKKITDDGGDAQLSKYVHQDNIGILTASETGILRLSSSPL